MKLALTRERSRQLEVSATAVSATILVVVVYRLHLALWNIGRGSASIELLALTIALLAWFGYDVLNGGFRVVPITWVLLVALVSPGILLLLYR